jgi:RNA polymerase sigma factor (TIGR02999 family)
MGELTEPVTQILDAVGAGDEHAAEQLLPLVYDELRRLAAARMAHAAPGQTLQPTALVHEAWLRLVGQPQQQLWNSRGHFFAAAAEAMRRILVERARRRSAEKHGGGLRRVDLDQVDIAEEANSDLLIALDEALTALAERDPTAAQLIKLRFFAGLPNAQAAELLGVPERTAKRAWAYARAWLYQEIRKKL